MAIRTILVLATASFCAIQSVALAQTAAAPASFEVATVKLSAPDARFTSFSAPAEFTFKATDAPLMGLLVTAYGVKDTQVVGLPNWAESARYDIVAKPPGDKPLDEAQLRQALQQLLADRLHVTVHHATRQVQGYRLVVARGEPKLQPGKGGRPGRMQYGENDLEAPNITLQEFGPDLRQFVGDYPVVDATGIKGSFDIKLHFATVDDTNSSQPSIFTALQEQLGLKLVRAKVPLDIIVIDHVDRIPAPN